MSSPEREGNISQLNKFEKLSWRPRSRDSEHCVPPARSGHRCIADSTNLYVFGGFNPNFHQAGGSENEDYPLFRELWRFHFATATWQQVRTEGYMPTELASMSAVLHGSNLLVFGGTGIPFGENNGNDLHVCDVQYKRWSLLNCRGKKPNKVYGPAMVIINGHLYVFGGTTGYLYSTDLHRLNLATREWTQLKPNNALSESKWTKVVAVFPSNRFLILEITNCLADGLAHRIYILGGGTSLMSYSLDQIHAYNLETNYWEESVTQPDGRIGFPAARRCHSCVQVKDEVFICGGYNRELILSDMWKINLQTFQWTKLPAVMPEPAYFHCAAVTPTPSSLIKCVNWAEKDSVARSAAWWRWSKEIQSQQNEVDDHQSCACVGETTRRRHAKTCRRLHFIKPTSYICWHDC